MICIYVYFLHTYIYIYIHICENYNFGMSFDACRPKRQNLGTIFDAFLVDLGFSWVPRGRIKYTWKLKMTTSGPHLAGAGPRDRFLVNLGCILGAILETILHTGDHLWQLLLYFGTLFVVMFLIWFRVPAVGGPMWLKHSKYYIRMRSPMSVMEHIWETFGTLLAPIVVNYLCRQLENHPILGSGFGSPCLMRLM